MNSLRLGPALSLLAGIVILLTTAACGTSAPPVTIPFPNPIPIPLPFPLPLPLPPSALAPVPLPSPEAAYTATGDWYQVFFSKPFYPETAADRQSGIDMALVADIAAANKTIDIASYDFNLETVTQALIQARQRGVIVRLVADKDANQDSEEFLAATSRLAAAGIPITFDTRPAFMHNKFMILDGSTLWTGSWNLTINDTYRNDNNTLRLIVPELVENYRRRFEHLFAGQMGASAPKDTPYPVVTLPNGVRIENYFSPNGGADRAIQVRLGNATRSIRVMAFTYTANDQSDILIEKQKAGLSVQGVFESRNTEGTGADYARLKRSRIDVLEDGNCYVMHNKVYIVDDRTVITGSYNFTASAEKDNDENLLIVDDPSLAAAYLAEFDRVYAQAKNPTKCGK